VKLPFRASVNEEDFNKLARGFVPESMDDKWFVFHEDDRLYFHRSWTGHCIFWMIMKKSAAGGQIIDVWANRDPGQYRSNDVQTDVEMLKMLFQGMLGVTLLACNEENA